MFRASSFLRELLIRTVITAIVSLVAFFYLHAGVWVFVLPVGVALLVSFKWWLNSSIKEDEQR